MPLKAIADCSTGTIITAFSNRQHRGDDSVNWTLQASLTRAFNNSHELSADHMIARIILRCISFLDIPAKAGLEEPAFDIFAVSIADLVSKFHLVVVNCAI